MDGRSFSGKTAVFLVICVFMAAFVLIFGMDYAIVGVIIATGAIFTLSKDLSVRPFSNMASLMGFMVALGIASHLSSFHPYLGLVINFAVVFVTVFLSMHDLRTPLHFPLLLCYTAMTVMPVGADEIPMRLMVLACGAAFIVGLNVMVNRGKNAGTSHRAVAAMAAEVRRCAVEVKGGGSPDIGDLEKLCTWANREMYDRLKSHFFTTPRDRRALDLTVSLMDLGREVCEREMPPGALRGIALIMTMVEEHERGEIPASEVAGEIGRFLGESPGVGPAAAIALKDLGAELEGLESGDAGEYGGGRRPDLETILVSFREETRRDSARFTFAVRMALMFALVSFAWDYWAWSGAQTMLYTIAAVITPYLEDSKRMSALRLSGTVLGALAFMAAVVLSGGSTVAVLAVGLAAGYAYVVLDKGRYDRRMFFYTLIVLVTAFMSDPSPGLAVDQILFTFAGIVVAVIANRVVLPYRIGDEVMELSVRSMAIARERIRNVRDATRGVVDDEEEAGLTIVSANISRKMGMSAERSGDGLAERFLIRQDSLSMQCSSLYKAARNMGPECRAVVDAVMSVDPDSDGAPGPADVSGMEPFDRECVRRAERIMATYRDNRRMMFDLIVSDYLRDGPSASLRVDRN